MKLTELLKEIQVVSPGRSILWGMKKNNKFSGLVKIRGFKTSQEALDEINKILGLDKNSEYEAYNQENFPIPSQTYIYFSGDGLIDFSQDLSSFSEGYNTEEDWGVVEWSTKPPLPR
jgi:hypothetical protein